jgi:hypothetical protein
MIRNPGAPVSSFSVNGAGDNRQGVMNADIDWESFNSGPYAELFLNGVMQIPSP